MTTDDTLRQNILDKIKNEDIKMTPRQFFFMKWFTMLVTSVFFLMLGFYIFAYIVFLFIDNGLVYMPIFSQQGLINFIIEIPWTLVLLGLLSIFLFSITSKTFYKIYRKPFLTFFFTILAIIILSHLIFVESGAMNYLKQEAYNGHLQLVPDKFLQFRDSQTGTVFVGYVVATTTNSIIVRDRRNEIFELIPESAIDFNMFSVGQRINAYGQRDGSKISVKTLEIVD